MGISESEKVALVKHKLERAKETMEDVRFAVENQRWFIAANRLYYACFYAAGALLINDGFEAHTHNGVKAMIGLHYTSKGLIDRTLSVAFGKIFNLRQTGDYDDMANISENDIKPFLAPAKEFINRIEVMINNKK